MALARVPFWFLRHGETDYNAAGLSQGALDTDLNATGRAQAAAAGPRLVGREIVQIIASPLRRARETAEIVNEYLGLDLAFEPGLREVLFGGMEGKLLQPWFPEWLEGRYTPPGAESFAEVTARVEAAMVRVLALPGPLLVVAHGGVFRALRDLMDLPKEGLTGNAQPLFCEPVEGGWRITPAPQV
jgi:probable phosphoglycerate mutase